MPGHVKEPHPVHRAAAMAENRDALVFVRVGDHVRQHVGVAAHAHALEEVGGLDERVSAGKLGRSGYGTGVESGFPFSTM